MQNFRDHDDFKYQVQKIIDEYLVSEEYCPHCNNHTRLLKVFDCSDRHWRCLTCLGLVYKISLPIKEITREYGAHPTAAELREYADIIEAEGKKRAEELTHLEENKVDG